MIAGQSRSKRIGSGLAIAVHSGFWRLMPVGFAESHYAGMQLHPLICGRGDFATPVGISERPAAARTVD
jgi:hypothetical protein